MKKKLPINLLLIGDSPFIPQKEKGLNWEDISFFEIITESYIPLLDMLYRLEEKKHNFKLNLCLSSALIHNLNNPFLQKKYEMYLQENIQYLKYKSKKNPSNSYWKDLETTYHNILHQYIHKYKYNLNKAFLYLFERGYLELLCTASTHTILPYYSTYPWNIQFQITMALDYFESIFHTFPKGFYLPELAYFPGIEKYFKQNGIQYSLISTNSLLANKIPSYLSLRPIQNQNIVYFPIDIPTHKKLLAHQDAYLTNASYQFKSRHIDFFSQKIDLSNNLSYKEIYKYFDFVYEQNKENIAENKIIQDSHNFLSDLSERADQILFLVSNPVINCAYEIEFFGRYWKEGLRWLECVITHFSEYSYLEASHFDTYLEKTHEKFESIIPGQSFVDADRSQLWLNSSNHWMYRHIFEIFDELYQISLLDNLNNMEKRGVNQVLREVALAQSSHHFVRLSSQTIVSSSITQFRDHINTSLGIINTILDHKFYLSHWLDKEKENNIFSDLNYTDYLH